MSPDRRKYDTTQLPINEDLSRFAPDYTPEVFTEDEQRYLRPFFSNLDKPVFVTHGLPEEVNAALDSRYSRSTKSKRRLFIEEYVNPIRFPNKQEDWMEKTPEERREATRMRDRFEVYISNLNEDGGIDEIVNLQRARGFFEKWLAGYGDDSIAEMGGGFHVSCEGVSSIAIEEIISQRIGISPLVKSTRYVQFSEKRPDGRYQYHVPGEIRGSLLEDEYRDVMDRLFDTYSYLEEAYLDYIRQKFPKSGDESDGSFERSRGAKRYDDIRDFLPFSTLNNIGLSGNGRAYEALTNRLLASRIGEVKWIGQQICRELSKVAPSFVKRPQTERGAGVQFYRGNINNLRDEMAEWYFPGEEEHRPDGEWSRLISSTPDADVEILTFYLAASMSDETLGVWRKELSKMTPEKRWGLIEKILEERKLGRGEFVRDRDRFKKVPRAFERAIYVFDLWARGGDMRDLRRHRMVTEGHAPFTVNWGINLEREFLESPFLGLGKDALKSADQLYDKLVEKFGPEVAQYCIPFAFIQHWFIALSARELYWIGELRTGPQARPHYKEVVLSMVDQAMAKDPGVFQGILVDRNDYRLARRESEKKRDSG